MLQLFGFALVAASLVFGYTTARQFVRTRLRYVDAVRSMRAPLFAGFLSAALVLLPFAIIPLPFFGLGAAAAFGVSVAVGVRAGVRDIRTASGYIEGP